MEKLQNILFLDIETASVVPEYDDMSERMKVQWARKSSYLKKDAELTDEDFFNQRAGIYSEFGKVVTVGLGFFHEEEGNLTLRTKAIYDVDEKKLLNIFKEVLQKMNNGDLKLCAHNGREFDFPYLSRRMLINGIALPGALDLAGKKPWEINHLDTMDMWKFGDWKNYTSLELLATVFDIESSKTDMDGSMVSEVFHKDKNLEKIAEYCIQDVVVTAQLYLKLKSIHPKNLQVVAASPN